MKFLLAFCDYASAKFDACLCILSDTLATWCHADMLPCCYGEDYIIIQTKCVIVTYIRYQQYDIANETNDNQSSHTSI